MRNRVQKHTKTNKEAFKIVHLFKLLDLMGSISKVVDEPVENS